MTEPLDLDALRALADAATPGPWGAPNDDLYYFGPTTEAIVHGMPLLYDGDGGDPWESGTSTARSHADLAFIAAARTAVPALIDEVERLRAVVASVEALCDEPAMEAGAEVPRYWLRVRDVRAALTAAQDAPAPTPTEEATP